MARMAILFGVLMIVLGGGLYVTAIVTDEPTADATRPAAVRALTALIPAAFGLVLVLLGAIASNGSDRTRMHAMHVAALIGLVGVGIPLWRVIKALSADGTVNRLAVGGNIAMAVLSAVFLVLCVNSFIQARRERKRREAEGARDVPV